MSWVEWCECSFTFCLTRRAVAWTNSWDAQYMVSSTRWPWGLDKEGRASRGGVWERVVLHTKRNLSSNFSFETAHCALVYFERYVWVCASVSGTRLIKDGTDMLTPFGRCADAPADGYHQFVAVGFYRVYTESLVYAGETCLRSVRPSVWHSHTLSYRNSSCRGQRW